MIYTQHVPSAFAVAEISIKQRHTVFISSNLGKQFGEKVKLDSRIRNSEIHTQQACCHLTTMKLQEKNN
jgi:hypothetical protein